MSGPFAGFVRFGVFASLVCLTFGLRAADEEPKKETPTISADKAAEYYDKEVVVEFKVESGYFRDGKPPCLLNSKKNHRDKDCFTVVFRAKEIKAYKETGVEDPALHFAGKTIKVRGIVEKRDEKPQIVVTNIKQVELVGETKSTEETTPKVEIKKQD